MSSLMICTFAACTRVSRTMTEDCRSPSDSRNGFETNAVFVFCCRDIRPGINCFTATSELNFAGRADMHDTAVFSLSPSFDGFGTVHYLIYLPRCRMGKNYFSAGAPKPSNFLCLEYIHNAMLTICAVERHKDRTFHTKVIPPCRPIVCPVTRFPDSNITRRSRLQVGL